MHAPGARTLSSGPRGRGEYLPEAMQLRQQVLADVAVQDEAVPLAHAVKFHAVERDVRMPRIGRTERVEHRDRQREVELRLLHVERRAQQRLLAFLDRE